jgi:hypothetical protein
VGRVYYVDAEGNRREVAPGEPIIIKQPAPAASQVNQGSFSFKGDNGEDIVMPVNQLETFFRLEDWKEKRKREQESHESHQDLIKEIKKAIPDVLKGAQDYISTLNKGDKQNG